MRILCSLFLALLVPASLFAAPASSTQESTRALYDNSIAEPAGPVAHFQAYGGEWQVKEGELWGNGGAGGKLISDAPAFSDGEAGVDIWFSSRRAGNAGLVVRVREPGVGADAFIGYEIALDAEKQTLLLGRHRHNFESIKETPCPVPLNQWIAFKVKLAGNVIEAWADGKRVLQYEDREHPLADGRIGLRPWQSQARFRNLWINTEGQEQMIAFESGATQGTISVDKIPVPPFAFITRHPLSRPNTISCDIWQSQPRQPGCSIRIFNPAQPTEAAKTIFSDPTGCIYDMNLSLDARTLFFSRRKAGEDYWHIYRIGVDGQGLRQLTDGSYYDISPMELPDGDLTFVSTRHGGYTLCQPGPASNLHRMAADGSRIQCVSMNTLADFSPQLLPDGRVLFTRWEYIDRDLTFRQSLWTQNPDGTGYQLFFGNTIRDVGTFWQARPLPGRTDRVVATFAPHHGWPHGAIGLIDTRHGPEAPRGQGYAYITREFPQIGDAAFEWSYRDPFPITEHAFLVAYGGEVNRYRIFVLDDSGNKRLLYEDASVGCYNPLPLKPMPTPPVIAPQQAASTAQTGAFLLTDVYQGLSGIERGRVKYLRIMEQVRKTEDLVNRAFDQSPVMSYATYYAKRCWGTVPVQEDGSAYFKAPAMREIYFQALDSEGRELQRMTSGAQVMPGQVISCIGCHEHRGQSPPSNHAPFAARQAPVEPLMPSYLKDGIVDFPTVVQPVLDKYCVRCHSGGNPTGGMMLTGDKTRFFNMAYDNLLGRSRSYRQHHMETGEMLPDERLKPKPLVHFYWLLRTPTAINQPLWTGSHASRLLDYIDTTHCEQKIPQADRERIYLWIDADVPYYGTYAHSRPQSAGRRDLCADSVTGRESEWFAKDFMGVYNRQCQSCHGNFPQPNDHAQIWDGRLAWINFSKPEFSPALTAHLAREAGGRGIVKLRDGRQPPLFKDAKDADYQTMLKAIETGKKLMLATPEADMPGFVHARKEM